MPTISEQPTIDMSAEVDWMDVANALAEKLGVDLTTLGLATLGVATVLVAAVVLLTGSQKRASATSSAPSVSTRARRASEQMDEQQRLIHIAAARYEAKVEKQPLLEAITTRSDAPVPPPPRPEPPPPPPPPPVQPPPSTRRSPPKQRKAAPPSPTAAAAITLARLARLAVEPGHRARGGFTLSRRHARAEQRLPVRRQNGHHREPSARSAEHTSLSVSSTVHATFLAAKDHVISDSGRRRCRPEARLRRPNKPPHHRLDAPTASRQRAS